MDTPYFIHVTQQTNRGNEIVPGADNCWANAPRDPSNKDFLVHFGRLFLKVLLPLLHKKEILHEGKFKIKKKVTKVYVFKRKWKVTDFTLEKVLITNGTLQ